MQRASEDATRNAMNALAVDTGGFLVANSNNLRAGLRKMLKDTETYYVLAYEPTNTTHDGGFRRIEVRLPGVPRAGADPRGLLRSRRPPRGRSGGPRRRGAAERATGTGMSTALTSLAPLTAIPVRLSADFLSGDAGDPPLVVSGTVDATLPFVRRTTAARRPSTRWRSSTT